MLAFTLFIRLLDQLPPLKLASQPSFQDPAIMSARVGAQYGTSESTPRAPSMNSYGPPPGIGYPPGLAPNISRVPSSAEASQTYGEFSYNHRGEGAQRPSTERRVFPVRNSSHRSRGDRAILDSLFASPPSIR